MLRHLSRYGVAGLVCVGLIGGAVSPAWANDGDGGSGETPVVGGFGLGDGIEGSLDERDGSFRFALPVGGLQLGWDSRGAGGLDRYGLGAAWGWGSAHVETGGGVRVFPQSGGAFEADSSHPSGLRGYGVKDVSFDQTPGVVPARRDGVVGPVEYSYSLSELGGKVTYFNQSGDPVAQLDGFENRTDWTWDARVSHRLTGVINADGVRTNIDWSVPETVLVRSAVNAGVGGGEWTVNLGSNGTSKITDPTNGQVTLEYDGELLSRVIGVSGAVTEVSWQDFGDGVSRVNRARVTDGLGVELSAREWHPIGLPSSGWPQFEGGENDVFWRGGESFRYKTALSDGATRVESVYNSLHTLIQRDVVASTGSTERTLQKQQFEYPRTTDGGFPNPGALPGNWSRPKKVDVVFTDAAGASRTTTETTVFDDLSRPTKKTGPDGTITETVYDTEKPDNAPLPVGLAVSQRVTAPVGLISEITNELNRDRTAVVASETQNGSTKQTLTVSGRTEYVVEPDGFVSEQRAFPQGGTGKPVITRWDKRVDLPASTVTTTETMAAGSSAEATTSKMTDLTHGGVVKQTDSVGNPSSAKYDAMGRVIEQTDASGNITHTAYRTAQADGVNATDVQTPDRVVTTQVRDELGRVTKVTDNIQNGNAVNGHVRVAERREYEPGVVKVTDSWGATTTTRQDVFGREVSTTGPTGVTKVTEHDEVSNTVTTGMTATGQLTDAELTTTESHDAAGRVTGTTGVRKDGQATPETQTQFDGFGRTISISDGTVNTNIDLDAFGNPTTTTLTPAATTQAGADAAEQSAPGSLTATRRFDEFGASVEKTLDNGDQTRTGEVVTLDEQGRTITEKDQLNRVSYIKYTPDGLVLKITAGSGQITQNEYDSTTRKITRSTVSSAIGSSVITEYVHDRVTGRLVSVFDPANRGGTEIKYAWDAFGNPLSVTYPDSKVVAHEYDQHGRKQATTDVAGNRTTFTYDQAGLIVGAVQRDKSKNELAKVRYAYDKFGRVTKLSRGNSVNTEYAFTSASEIASELTTRNGQTLSDRKYTYDAKGNLTTRTDTTRNESGELAASTTRYTYDAFDRLTRSTVHNGATTNAAVSSETGYELTVSGDVATETVTNRPGTPEASATTRSFEYNPLGELLTINTTDVTGTTRAGQEYDAAGNLTLAFDGTRYAYDAANRPKTETTPDGITIETGYWADGTRKHLNLTDPGNAADSENSTKAATEFYWDGTTLLNETHTKSGEEDGVASYLIGSGRHARSVANGNAAADTSYFGTDRHGNVTDLTATTGQITNRYTYSDYGITTASGQNDTGALGWDVTVNPFTYASEYTNPTGTQHLATRTYDAESMRLTSKDNADLHNRYAFANLNPITWIDPTGRTAEKDILNYVVVGVGAVMTGIGILGAAFTGGGSLGLLGAAGIFMDVYSTGAAIANVVNSKSPFMSSAVADGLMWGELALLGGIGIGSLIFGKVWPKMTSWFSKKIGKKADDADPFVHDLSKKADDADPFFYDLSPQIVDNENGVVTQSRHAYDKGDRYDWFVDDLRYAEAKVLGDKVQRLAATRKPVVNNEGAVLQADATLAQEIYNSPMFQFMTASEIELRSMIFVEEINGLVLSDASRRIRKWKDQAPMFEYNAYLVLQTLNKGK